MILLLYVLIGAYALLYLYIRLCIRWCTSKVCLSGKTAIVTGGNSGIGFRTAMELAMRGCRVIIADVDDSTASRDKIVAETKNPNVIVKQINLMSLKSVRQFAADILKTEKRLHILICNAGIGSTDLDFTEDGLQKTMQVNYFSHFLLVHLLLGLLEKSKPSRVIFTSSVASYFSNLRVSDLNPSSDYNDNFMIFNGGLYGNSKLAMACACVSFSEHFKDKGVTFNSQHPGGANTNIFSMAWKNKKTFLVLPVWAFAVLFGRSPEESCQTSVHLACSKELENVTGNFFMDCAESRKPKLMKDPKACEEIWEKSIELVKLKPEENLCK